MTQGFSPGVPAPNSPAQSDPLRKNMQVLYSQNAGVTVPIFHEAGTPFWDEQFQELRVAITDSLIAQASDENFRTVWALNSFEQKIKSDADFTTSSINFVPIPGLSVSLFVRTDEKVFLGANLTWDGPVGSDTLFDMYRDGEISLTGVTNGVGGTRPFISNEIVSISPQLLYVATQSRVHVFGVSMRQQIGGVSTLRADGVDNIGIFFGVRQY